MAKNIEKRFSVVEFLDERNSVYVVPNLWLEFEESLEGMETTAYCSWPKTKDLKRVKYLCLASAKPDSTWSQHHVKVVYQSRSRQKAMDKLIYYENHSDVEPFSTDCGEFSTSGQRVSSQAKASTSISPCSNCVELKGILRKILNVVTNVELRVEHNSSALQKLTSNNTKIPTSTEDLPVETLESLREVDAKIGENDEKFSNMVMILGLRGGKDECEATRRVLTCLMTNALAMKLNWQGGPLKTSLKTFPQILKLIVVSVRQNTMFNKATDASVEDAIKRWLRTANDRDGGRHRRRSVTSNIQNTDTDV